MKQSKATLTSIFLILLPTVFACGYSEEEMQAKRQRIDDLTLELQAANRKGQELTQRLEQLSKQNADMTAKLETLGNTLGQQQKALQELRERKKQAEKRLQTFQDMLGKFKQMIASGKLRVRIVRNRMVVELAENILFDSGKADIKPEGKTALTEVAEVLKSIPEREFQIAGHTDNVPIKSRRFRSNWELSAARAVNVTKYLAEQGVPAEKLSAAGHADTLPVADNETPEGRQQNRRIEIVLMPNLNELPDLSALEGMSSQ